MSHNSVKKPVSAKSVTGNSLCVLSSVLNVSVVWWWQATLGT